jgi:hypothetical protein
MARSALVDAAETSNPSAMPLKMASQSVIKMVMNGSPGAPPVGSPRVMSVTTVKVRAWTAAIAPSTATFEAR